MSKSQYLKSFTPGTPMRMDNTTELFFANELQNSAPVDIEQIIAPLTGINLFYERPVYELEQVHTYNMFETTGSSKYIDAQNGEVNDIPYVNVGGQQFTSPIRDIAVSVPFSKFELQAQGIRDTISMKKRGAMRSNYSLMNNTLFFGNNNFGLPGLLNNKNLPAATVVANGASGSPHWSSKTGEEILTDLSTAYNAASNATENLIPPDTLLISASMLNFIKNSWASSSHLTQTILEVFLADNSTIRYVIPAYELNGAFSGGTNGFIMFHNNEEFIYHVVAVAHEFLPPEMTGGGLQYRTLCHSRHGGLIITQPLMFSIKYGI